MHLSAHPPPFERIAVISLNRPPVNAFDISAFKEFTALINKLENVGRWKIFNFNPVDPLCVPLSLSPHSPHKDGVDAAVITSSKRDLFSAGLDLKVSGTRANTSLIVVSCAADSPCETV